MSKWLPDLSVFDGPKYRAIVSALAADIKRGVLPVGARLPTHRDLAWRLNVTVGTVARAYAEAERHGLVSGEVGRGTYVSDPGHSATTVMGHYSQMGDEHNSDGMINMAANHPEGDQGASLIGPILARLSQNPNLPDLLAYRFGAPTQRHRLAGAAWLSAEGAPVRADQVTITAGSQQAILASLAVATLPGDMVAVEEFTYAGIKAAISLMGRHAIPVAMDRDGLVPDEVDRAFQRGARMLCTIATVQNPTTSTLSVERRKAIAESARRHDAFIVEDGVHRFLNPNAPEAILVHAPERSIYFSTMSKSVSPGLRTTFCAVPLALRPRFDAAIAALTLSLPMLLVEVATQLIEDGSAFAMGRDIHAELVARAAIAVEILGERVRPRSAAFNVWLPLPPRWLSATFVNEAARQGVKIAPTETFAVGRPLEDGVRLSVSCPRNREELRRGLTVVANLLESEPMGYGVTV